MNGSVVMPRQQPQKTPSTEPATLAALTERMPRCAAERLGRRKSIRSAAFSTTPPKRQPLTSEQMLPQAAAVSVESPKATPKVLSIASPA